MENVENIVMASIAIHIYLKETDNAMHCSTGFIDHETTNEESFLDAGIRKFNQAAQVVLVIKLQICLCSEDVEVKAMHHTCSIVYRNMWTARLGHCRGNWTVFVALNNWIQSFGKFHIFYRKIFTFSGKLYSPSENFTFFIGKFSLFREIKFLMQICTGVFPLCLHQEYSH